MMSFWKHIKFANPEAFYLLAIPVLMMVYYIWRNPRRYATLTLSTLKSISGIKNNWKSILKQSLIVFRIAALCLLIICLARPQTSLKEENITSEGIDIILSLDISKSMLARDFKPDRLEAAKILSVEFIEGRPNDRIGFVVFAGESFTQCPITTDHAVLKKLVNNVTNGIIEDGTAIGMGLATAVNRLQQSEAKSKVIILMTDGVSNKGFIDPITAVDLAIQNNIRVYTIGVGTKGVAPTPYLIEGRLYFENMEVNIDENLLKKIAASTGGLYYRATNNKSLKKIFEEIDMLEKSKIEVSSVQRLGEEFLPFAIGAIVLLLVEMLLKYTVLKSIT